MPNSIVLEPKDKGIESIDDIFKDHYWQNLQSRLWSRKIATKVSEALCA